VDWRGRGRGRTVLVKFSVREAGYLRDGELVRRRRGGRETYFCEEVADAFEDDVLRTICRQSQESTRGRVEPYEDEQVIDCPNLVSLIFKVDRDELTCEGHRKIQHGDEEGRLVHIGRDGEDVVLDDEDDERECSQRRQCFLGDEHWSNPMAFISVFLLVGRKGTHLVVRAYSS
jgi:hypothetical protein